MRGFFEGRGVQDYGFVLDPEKEKGKEVSNRVLREIDFMIAEKRKLVASENSNFFCARDILQPEIDRLTSQEVSDLYNRTISEIKDQTSYFDDVEEAGMYQFILNEFSDEHLPADVSKVLWRQEDIPGGGRYEGSTEIIRIKDMRPLLGSALVRLATAGYFPSREILAHEGTHGYQSFPKSVSQLLQPKEMLLYDLVHFNEARGGLELDEAHAAVYGEGPSHPTDGAGADETTEWSWRQALMERIESEPYFGDSDKTMYAVSTMEQLRALGVPSKDIGRIIQVAGEWDVKTHMYPKLETLVATKAREYFRYNEDPAYVPREFDYVADVENLIQLHHLKVDINNRKAVAIAQGKILEIMPEKIKHELLS